MSTPQTVSDFATLAREAILAGALDEAEKYTNQAKALKGLDALTPQVDATKRLPFPTEMDAPNLEQTAQQAAMKTWYAKQYGGDLDGDVATVLNDMYGQDYRHLRWAKSADFVRWIRTGKADPKLERLVLYTPDQVLAEIATGATVQELKATQLESQDSAGGYLVPEDFRDSVVSRIQGLTQMRSIAETITTVSDRVTMPVSDGGDDRYTGSVRVYKVDESPTGAQSQTQATFSQATVPVYTIMANIAVSKNLLDDSRGGAAITPYLNSQFATAYAVFEDEQFIVGNGIAGPQGILKDNGTGGPYAFSYGSIATTNSGAATSLLADSFRNMPYSIASQYRQPGAKWLMSRGTVRVVKTLKAGDGTYLWSSRGDAPALQGGQPAGLEGYSIAETEVLGSPTATNGTAYTANTYPVIFITKGSYLIVDKAGGMDVQRYDDSTTAVANSIRLVMRRRVGGQVILPWGIGVMKVST